jgi:hypothetical protein
VLLHVAGVARAALDPSVAGAPTADGVSFDGTVTALRAFRGPDGRIRTVVTLDRTEPRRGRVAGTMRVIIDGGELDGRGERRGDVPRFRIGERRRLSARPSGTGAPAEWQAVSAPLAEDTPVGEPAPLWFTERFIACDRGEPILYRVDTNTLPAGITPAQALTAVANACQAWSAASTVRFRFDGCEAFGAAAPNLGKSDRRLWIQLYNYGNYIPPASTTLGEGGFSYSALTGSGGKIGSQEFSETRWGYVIIKHTARFFTNSPKNLEEVLCHEIGHVAGLGHSALSAAIMYDTAHGGNRGATLGGDDVAHILGTHPLNTPPYTLNRAMNILTRPGAQITPSPGVNATWLPVYDLQGTNGCTLVSIDANAVNGTFTRTGLLLAYTPRGYFGYQQIDPASDSYFDRYNFRISDGTNLSPAQYYVARVTAFLPDANLDALPDDWFAASGSPSGGAAGDPDGDGFSNQREWMQGTHPKQAASHLKLTAIGATNFTWLAKPYELYDVLATNRPDAAFRFLKPAVPTTTNGSAWFDAADAPSRFFRIRHVP